MKLKSLEIKGFKSFANHTILHFNEDVTGVVGPNGSGKSNIVDAIRWVLGEQKGKNLRLESRADVIFNGAKGKKAAGVAQVSVTFTNTKNLLPTEYNEVKISRFQYRNGDSEYQLNGVKCRLRDINDLLVDTGIGSNSYAIIALGMVEDILKDKDNARRKMFEQVSGISKYKKRKKETINKLKSTTEDLDRVEDLLHEIDGNMKMLEKQAKRTEQFFELKQKYKDESIRYSVLSIADLKEKHQKFTTKIDTATDKYRELEIEITKKEADIEEHKRKQLSEEQNLSEKQKSVNLIVSDIREKEAAKDLLNQELSFKKESIKNSQNVIERNSPMLTQLHEDKAQKEAALKELRLNLEGLEQEFAQVKEAHIAAQRDYHESKNKFDVLAQKRQSLEQEGFERAKELAIESNRKSVFENDLKNLLEEIQAKNNDQAGLSEQLQKVESEVNEIQSKIQAKENEKSQLSAEVDLLNKQKIEIEENLVKTNRKLDSKNNEHTLLESMIQNQEGFPESIKFLSKNWNSKVSVLSDVLDVAHEYKGIIEHFLEPYLNHYLVENVAEAADAIQLLSKSQKGKAQFFLLDRIPVITGNPFSHKGKPAMEVVKVDERYQKLLNYLLQDVYLTDKPIDVLLDDSTYLSVKGDFVKKVQTVSGGSVGLFEGKKIGRKKELEKLTAEIAQIESKRTELEAELVDINVKIKKTDLAHLDSELDELKKALNEINQDYVALKTKKAGLTQSMSELDAKRNNVTASIASIVGTIANVEEQIKFVQEAMGSKEVEEGNPDQLDLLAEKLSKEAQQYNAKNIELIQKKSEEERLSNDLEFSLRRIKELNERLDESKSILSSNENETTTISDKIKALDEELKLKYEGRENAKSELSVFEQDFFSKRNSISDKEDELRTQNRVLQQTQLMINETKDKFNDVKFQMGAVGERLKIEFEVELDSVINQEFEPVEKIKELKDKIERQRRRIANFGEINPMAVEAFNTMKERHDLISGQRNDILEAKDSLMETIAEIETTATVLFRESFDKVRENFQTVFRSLFSEDDSCDLVLLDEENPLDSSIDIIARPKGKRPLSLSQLSGGEMTLTATALLFAFYLQKPAPFCIFDEVDAPLDDVNVLKFNKIIKKFSERSQFIVVTHNKATMAEVDVLYGVYMQDMGISSVSPVDFRTFGHDPVMEDMK
jgi:chromosome segregation protein